MSSRKKKSEKQISEVTHSHVETARTYYPLIFFFALLLLMAFLHKYSQAAFPLRGVFISGGMAAVALGAFLAGYRDVAIERKSLTTVLLFGGFTAWCIIRNYFAPVPAIGRYYVSIILEGFWVLSGVVLLLSMEKSPGSAEKHPFGDKTASSESPRFNLSLRMMAVYFFIGLLFLFVVHGIYQYFIGYESQFEKVKELGVYGEKDPIGEGVMHALKERRPASVFGNPNLFGAFIALCFPFLIFAVIRLKALYLRIIFGLIGISGLFVLILSRSRGGLLSLFFAVIFFGFLRFAAGNKISKKHLRTLIIVFVLIGIMIIIFAVIQNATRTEDVRGGSIFQRMLNISTVKQRLYYWKTGFNIIGKNPFFGTGPGGYGLFYPRYRVKGANETRYAHNFIIQIWSETGLVGLILFLGFIGYAFRAGFRRIKESPAAVPAFAASAVFIFNALFEYSFYHDSLFLDFCLFAGLMFAGHPVRNKTVKGRGIIIEGPTRSWFLLGVVLVISLIFLPSFVAKPLLSDARIQYGDDAMDAEVYEEALRHYQKAASYEPDDPWTHQRLGQITFRLGDPSTSENQLKKALELNPYSASLHDELAHFYAATYRIEKALELERESTKIYPLKSEYHFNLAKFLLEAGKREEAMKSLKEAIKVETDPGKREGYREFAKERGLEM